jgi:hypothetical protein
MTETFEVSYTSYDFGTVIEPRSLIWAGHIPRIEKYKHFLLICIKKM